MALVVTQRQVFCAVCACRVPQTETIRSKYTGNRYCKDFKACGERKLSGQSTYDQGLGYINETQE